MLRGKEQPLWKEKQRGTINWTALLGDAGLGDVWDPINYSEKISLTIRTFSNVKKGVTLFLK